MPRRTELGPRRAAGPAKKVSLPRALSKLGLCSRKQAFERIVNGQVAVNGAISCDIALRVDPNADHISVSGVSLRPARRPIVLAMNKPAGYVTTRADPQGRPTVYDLLPRLDRFVFPVGRLDKDTEGLLLFTNDHRLGEKLTNPASHVPKTYTAEVDRLPDRAGLQALRNGLSIGRGEVTLPARVETSAPDAPSPSIKIVIHEGRNRQIRRMLAAVGVEIFRLTRVGIGALSAEQLAVGASRRLSDAETKSLTAERTPFHFDTVEPRRRPKQGTKWKNG